MKVELLNALLTIRLNNININIMNKTSTGGKWEVVITRRPLKYKSQVKLFKFIDFLIFKIKCGGLDQ